MNRAAMLLVASAILLADGRSATFADDIGREFFASACEACHGAAGVGTEGVAPPLVNPDVWGRLGDRAPDYLAGVLAGGLSGRISANGVDYIGLVMPPQSEVGTAEELAAVANYVLNDLNGVVAAADAATIENRQKTPLSHRQLRAMREGK